ncbi:MAG: hypothetical protein VB099_07190 [Candidatus Limiplasma sp.]|nr:hypothetical protein [Candidatus Limiplasma sp.]
MRKRIFLYPWDVAEEGAQKLAQELRSWGVTDVSLALAYHQARMLLPHHPRRRTYLHPSGRVYFPFQADRYGSLRPQYGPLIQAEGEGFLSMVQESFGAEGIRVSGWVVLLHNSRLASSHPGHAIQTAFGDCSPSNLCPSSPETRCYARQALRDIAAAGIREVHLESLDYGGFLHGDHHEMQAYGDTAELDRLMGLCFCPHCLGEAQRRGMDGEALRSQVMRAAQAFLDFSPQPPVDQGLWEEYQALRAERITGLYRDIRGDCPDMRLLPILWMAQGADPRAVGVDVRRLEGLVDGAVAAYPQGPQDVAPFVERVKAQAPGELPVTYGVRLMAPQTLQREDVYATMRAYRQAGVRDMIFYQYGMAPRPFLEAMGEGEC